MKAVQMDHRWTSRQPRVAKTLGAAYERRYVALTICVFALLVSHTLNQQWVSDVWEHGAAVRELALRPFAPRHPLLPIDAPHHSYSLYTWTLAQAVRQLGLSPIEALSIGALINAALILAFFPLAVSALSGRRDLSFYSLLFTLLLWGPGAWRFSGFLHLNALGFVLPFPSMFATAIAFLVIGIMPVLLKDSRPWRWILPVGALIFLVVNAHQITAGSLIVACLAVALSLRPTPGAWLSLSGAIVVGVLVAIWWPLFPLLRLIFEGRLNIDWQNRFMYLGVLLHTAPALLGLPLLLRRVRRHPLDPLGVIFGVLLMIYGAGWVTSNFTLGRVIPFLVLPLHISLAEWVVDNEQRATAAGPVGWLGATRVRAIVAGALLVTSINIAPGMIRAVPTSMLPASVRSRIRLDKPSEMFRGLDTALSDGDIVIAPPSIMFRIPTFGGKVIASRPHPFINYDEAALPDVERFFTIADQATAVAILKKYGVTKIVLERAPADDVSRFRCLGSTVFSNSHFEVIAVGSAQEWCAGW